MKKYSSACCLCLKSQIAGEKKKENSNNNKEQHIAGCVCTCAHVFTQVHPASASFPFESPHIETMRFYRCLTRRESVIPASRHTDTTAPRWPPPLRLIAVFGLELAAAFHQLCSETVCVSSSACPCLPILTHIYCPGRGGESFSQGLFHDTSDTSLSYSIYIECSIIQHIFFKI